MLKTMLLLLIIMSFLYSGVQGQRKIYATIETECKVEANNISCSCLHSHEPTAIKQNGYNWILDIVKRFKNTTNLFNIQLLRMSNCNQPFKIEIDLYHLKGLDKLASSRLTNVREIIIEDSDPISAYFRGRAETGDLTITFRNIRGADNGRSVSLAGGVDFCSKSCLNYVDDKKGPPSLREDSCNECIPSNVKFNFINIEHVYMGHFGIASYDIFNDEGHAILYAERIDTVLVEDPFMSNVVVESFDAKECWLKSKVNRNPYTTEQVDCNSYGGSGGLHWGYILLIVIISFFVMFCCTALVCTGIKKG